MSKLGRINRGGKWWATCRDADGNLLPVVKENPHMMEQVNDYLKAKKEAEEKAVKKKETKSVEKE